MGMTIGNYLSIGEVSDGYISTNCPSLSLIDLSPVAIIQVIFLLID